MLGLVLTFFVLAAVWTVQRLGTRISSKSNINGPPTASFLTGNLLQIIAPDNGREFQLHLASVYGGIARVRGLLWGNSLFVSDLKALNHILVQNQDTFEEWSAFTATNSILFGDGLVATIGDQHKKQRKMLNPVFSVKHLRGMTPTFFNIANKLEHAILAKVDAKAKEIDMTGWLNRTALELIGQSGMGHSFVDFSDDEGSNTFADAAKDLAATVSVMVPLAPLTPILVKLGSPGLRRWMVRMVPWPLLQRLRQIVDIMADAVLNIFQAKKRELVDAEKDHDGARDIMGILLKANSASLEKDRLSDSELLGQMATLIFTASDTSSGALARLLHLLAQHPDVQEKLRSEIVNAFKTRDSDLDYDGVSALPYLDAVIKETLRVFPPIPMVFRQTCQDAVVPLLNPIRGVNGKLLHEVAISQGTDIFISILGANHDKSIWGEDANEWKPDRWLKPLPESVTKNHHINGVYSHMMTFLTGGRACIGFKFAELEIKVVLASLLRSLKFSLPADKEIHWNMGLLMTPVVSGSQSIHSAMPLWVSKLDPQET